MLSHDSSWCTRYGQEFNLYRLDHRNFPWDKCVWTVKVGHTHRFDMQYYHSHFCTHVKTLLGVLCDSDAPDRAYTLVETLNS